MSVTITAILHYFAPFVEIEYFTDRQLFTILLAHFSLHMRKNGTVCISDLKPVVTVVFSDIDFS